jgi:hypothetical protein
MNMYNQPWTNKSDREFKDGCFVQQTFGLVGPHGAAFFVVLEVPP